jgi:hypothetical protein
MIIEKYPRSNGFIPFKVRDYGRGGRVATEVFAPIRLKDLAYSIYPSTRLLLFFVLESNQDGPVPLSDSPGWGSLDRNGVRTESL